MLTFGETKGREKSHDPFDSLCNGEEMCKLPIGICRNQAKNEANNSGSHSDDKPKYN